MSEDLTPAQRARNRKAYEDSLPPLAEREKMYWWCSGDPWPPPWITVTDVPCEGADLPPSSMSTGFDLKCRKCWAYWYGEDCIGKYRIPPHNKHVTEGCSGAEVETVAD